MCITPFGPRISTPSRQKLGKAHLTPRLTLVAKKPKSKCCVSKPRCTRCPLRMLAEGTLPAGYTVKKRRLVAIDAGSAPTAPAKKSKKAKKSRKIKNGRKGKNAKLARAA